MGVNFNKILNCFSDYLKLEKSLGNPYIKVLEPTNACMMNCVMCPRKEMTRKVEYMDLNLFKKIIDQAEWNNTLDLSQFGDPLMHPQIDKMIEYATKKGIKTHIYANPNLLSEEMCIKLMKAKLYLLDMTIDGVNDKTYKYFRGQNADFGEAVKNIDVLLRLKKEKKSDMKIIVSMIYMEKNKNDVETFKKIWNKEGIDRVDVKNFGTFDGSDKEIFKYAIKESNQKKFGLGNGPCAEPWMGVAVTASGKVVPCCLDYDEKYVIGDLKRESLQDIWTGKRLRTLRKYFKNNLTYNITLCRMCMSRRKISIFGTIMSKILDKGDVIKDKPLSQKESKR